MSLFNRRRFFECHDVLEVVWLATPGPIRTAYQGLIQAAIAYHHWSHDNPGGAMSLYRSSRRHLAPFAPTALGLDLAAFLRGHDACFSRDPLGAYHPLAVPVLQWLADER